MKRTDILYKVETGRALKEEETVSRAIYLDPQRLQTFYVPQLIKILKLHEFYFDNNMGTYFCIDDYGNIVVVQAPSQSKNENIEHILYSQCEFAKRHTQFIWEKLQNYGIPYRFVNLGNKDKIFGYTVSENISKLNMQSVENTGFNLYIGKPTLYSNNMMGINWYCTKDEMKGHYIKEVSAGIEKWHNDKVEADKRKNIETVNTVESVSKEESEGTEKNFSTIYKECEPTIQKWIDDIFHMIDREGCSYEMNKTLYSIHVGEKAIGSIMLTAGHKLRISCDADDRILGQFDEIERQSMSLRNQSKTMYQLAQASWTNGVGNVRIEVTNNYQSDIAQRLVRKAIQVAKMSI